MKIRKEHYKIQVGRDTGKRILKLIQDHPEGLQTGELRNMSGLSMNALSPYLKEFENKGKIELFRDPTKDRRIKTYRITQASKEEVKTEVAIFDAVRFIHSVPNPVLKEAWNEKRTRAIAVFLSSVTRNRQDSLAIAESIAGKSKGVLGLLPGLKKGEKVAVVIMMNGEK